MATYKKGCKFRIYPSNTQKDLIHRILGCCRFVYNHFLALRRNQWASNHESLTYIKTSKLLTELKRSREYVWLNEVDSMALQEALRNLDRAYQNFFQGRAKYPRFKSLVHERISNIRRDFLHKASTGLVRQNQTIAIENLKIKNMMKNHRLAKAISDVSWSEFFRQLTYKAVVQGAEILKVDTFYPSSQTCSQCGHQYRATKNLSVREWTCPECGTHHDRDENATKNILRKALEQKQHNSKYRGTHGNLSLQRLIEPSPLVGGITCKTEKLRPIRSVR